jgi:hypothetical protein
MFVLDAPVERNGKSRHNDQLNGQERECSLNASENQRRQVSVFRKHSEILEQADPRHEHDSTEELRSFVILTV